MSDAKNDFDVAKSVSDLLTGLKKEQQQRVLRWVAESLEIEISKLAVHQPRQEPPLQVEEKGFTEKSAHRTAERTADIKTFVAAKSPKSDVQYAAVVAYYYRFEAPASDRRDSITAEVLQESTRLVGNRKRLDKPNTTLNNAKNLGYLDSPARGEFRINTVGENLVAMTLPGQEGGVPPGRNGTRREGKKA
jgi:hypothetical protein